MADVSDSKTWKYKVQIRPNVKNFRPPSWKKGCVGEGLDVEVGTTKVKNLKQHFCVLLI